MEFSYPLSPTLPIEEGSKQIVFEPPGETLTGERIHQWIGARAGSDLHRIERQKIFLRRLIEEAFDFERLLDNSQGFRCSAPQVLEELSQVTAKWHFATLSPLAPQTIDGKMVLVSRRQLGEAGHPAN
jgi:hypothetical protein